MQSRLQPVDIKALPPAHRAIFQAQQTANDELRARVELLTDTNRRLEHLIGELRRAIYDKKSEKRPLDDRQLAFEDLEGAVAEAEEAAAAPGTSTGPSSASRRAPRRNLGHLPRGLERIEHVIEPDSTQCPCGCDQMIRIGEDRTERLDIVPAQLRVIVTVRPKYACRTCEAGVIQAPAPAHLITGGLPTEGALAQVLIAKYGDHLPLYRQSQIYARSGVELHRSTLAGWVGKASFHLTPVVDRLAWHLKQSGQLFMDETRAPVLDPGRGKTKTGYLWALARDERPWAGLDPPGVAFFYAPGRGGVHAARFLEGFTGILQVDGYAGYNAVAAPGKGVTRAYCWAYVAHAIMLRSGSCAAPDMMNLHFLRNIICCIHSVPRKAISPLFAFHGRSGPGSAASQSAIALAFSSISIRAWLGHVSLDTTNIHAEIDLDTKAQAIALCDAAKLDRVGRGRTNPG